MNLQKVSRRKDQLKTFSKWKIFVGIIGILFILGTSYALFKETLKGEKNYTITSRGLKIYLDESKTTNDIILTDAIPVLDAVGKQYEKYAFSLVNEDTENLEYTIYLKENELENKTPSSAIKYQYTRDVGHVEVIRNMEEQKTDTGRYYLETGVIPSNSTYNYTFVMWIDYNAGNEIMGTTYSLQLEIEAVQSMSTYKELVLNGCDPVLSSNLVPVTIEDDGKVLKADVTTEWYKYSEQRWANAVVLEDKTIPYAPGDTIEEENIESYFVWIPRYKYKLFNMGEYTGITSISNTAVQVIEIEFENKNVPPSIGTKVGDFHSHPAFQAFDSNGFWVGKFEPGYRGATSTSAAQVNSSDSSKLIIKPNMYSWRNISAGNSFKVSYDYLRSDESHMMKNTEWGAVAYLQHSNYGSHESVRVNNNRSYITGYAAVSEPTCGPTTNNASSSCNLMGTDASVTRPYNTAVGYTASTTGNITGIYDMSGNSWEYVMAYNTNASSIGGRSDITSIYPDFFTNIDWKKYYDVYSNTSPSNFANRILGDATGEMGPFAKLTAPNGTSYQNASWYNDYVYFITADYSWFMRGGYYINGSLSGIFSFNAIAGNNENFQSFRVVLTPKN